MNDDEFHDESTRILCCTAEFEINMKNSIETLDNLQNLYLI